MLQIESATEQECLRPGLIAVDGDWALWRQVGLRGAGFPSRLVRSLSHGECAAAAARLLAAEEHLAAARTAAGQRLDAALDDLKQRGLWEDEAARRHLLDGRRAVYRGRLPKANPPLLDELAAGLEEAENAARDARQDFDRRYAAALAEQSVALRSFVLREDVQLALLWQNRTAFHGALKGLTRPVGGGGRNSQRRQNEELAASYLQRYTVKNDTIGFFGPMGWASFAGEGSRFEVRPGPRLLAGRQVYVETWCFESLARVLERDATMRPWLCPRPASFLRLLGTTLHLPFQPPIPLPPARAAILAACDGRKTAHAIALDLLARPGLGLRGEADVYQVLEQLQQLRLVEWSLFVPIHPLAGEELRRQVAAVGDSRLRGLGLAALDAIEEARRAVAAASDSLPDLDRSLGELDAVFTRITGTSGTHRAGETYAGRTLAYEDCVRAVEMEIGPEVRAAMSEPLALVLASARWFTAEIATVVRDILHQHHRELAQQLGSPTVELIHFWYHLQPLLFAGKSELAKAVRQRLNERWEAIFGLEPGQRRRHFTAAELRPEVERAFACGGAGWPLARYHCPDIMIAAAGPEAVRRGEYQLVMGEMHAAVCTLNAWVFAALCPEQAALFAHLETDMAQPRAVFLEPRSLPGVTARTRRAYFSPKDLYIQPLDTHVQLPDVTSLPMTAMIVDQVAGTLTVSSRDGRWRFEAVDFFGDLLSGFLATEFGLLGSAAHWPRITIDRMVVWRESWTFAAADLAFGFAVDGAERYLAARRWARLHDLPSTAFVKVPVEQKPFYVDFDSPIYVDLLARAVRRTVDAGGEDQVKISEMLPGGDEAWLIDAEGERYASELRLVMVDTRTGAGATRT